MAAKKKAARKAAAKKMAAKKMTARKATKPQPTTKTAGAIKAGGGRYTFDFAELTTIDAGPGYSTSHGPVVEGERIQIGLMRMPRGTGSRPHSHPNEQWIYVMQGTLESEVAGVRSRGNVGSLIYIPANAVHSALATLEADVVFLTAKDMSHGIAGRATDGTASGPAYAEGFAPQR
ncbi:MAG TPA: cupin domain-containing protein [Methylomirabilota bacterium]|nr:cupin domain-containing protein [Methylomirabilota bacterium]